MKYKKAKSDYVVEEIKEKRTYSMIFIYLWEDISKRFYFMNYLNDVNELSKYFLFH